MTGRTAQGSGAPTRRAHPRVGVEREANLASEHNFYAELCENLSAGGNSVATHALCHVDERVDFGVELPAGSAIRHGL